jgi:hypothetical protein
VTPFGAGSKLTMAFSKNSKKIRKIKKKIIQVDLGFCGEP